MTYHGKNVAVIDAALVLVIPLLRPGKCARAGETKVGPESVHQH